MTARLADRASTPTDTDRADAAPCPAGAGNGNESACPIAAGATVSEAMIRHAKTCPAQATVADVRRLFNDPHVHAALIVTSGDRLVAVIERDDLTAAVAPDEPAKRFGGLTGRTTTVDAALTATHEAMSNAGRRRLAVTDARHRLLGLLCLKSSGLGFCSDRDVYARSLDPTPTSN
jgi:CBS-domain-containing membrane protein